MQKLSVITEYEDTVSFNCLTDNEVTAVLFTHFKSRQGSRERMFQWKRPMLRLGTMLRVTQEWLKPMPTGKNLLKQPRNLPDHVS